MSPVITCPACGLQGQRAADAPAEAVQCPRCGTTIAAAAELFPACAEHPLDAFFAACERPAPSRLPVPLPGLTLSENASTPVDASAARAEGEWIAEERERLQAYMAEHFGALRRQREEFSTWRSRVEAALVGREQEVNRQHKLLTSRSETVAEAEALIAAERERQSQALEALEERSQACAAVHENLAAEQARVEQLRAEAERWQEATHRARGECQALEEAVHNRKTLWEAEEARQRGRGEDLDRRQKTLDRAEEELRQCVVETEELEAQIRRDLERQRRELTRESRELENRRLEVALSSGRLERRQAEMDRGAVASPFVEY